MERAQGFPELLYEIAGWALTQGAKNIAELPGVWSGETPEWRVRFNGHKEEREGVPPYSASLEHKTFLAVAIVGPGGGSLMGASEDDLIEHFKSERERGAA